ncbi:MAG: aminoacyl-tRNA hydrolase [Clostridia bacterium]|nr:aminoacyl-tRNA hydrolase [Clostridia bacterium]
MKKKSVFSAIFYSVFLYLWYRVCQYAVAFGIQVFALYSIGLSDKAVAEFYYSYIYHANILGGLLFVGSVFLFHRGRLAENCRMKKISSRPAVLSLFLGAGFYSVSLALMQFATLIPSVEHSMEEYARQNEIFTEFAASPLWEILAVIFLAPLAEEILFRGLMLNRLKQSVSPAVAILFSALAFAVFHGNLYQGVYTFVFGLATGFVVHRFSSLWYGVLMHFSLNCINTLVLLPRMFPHIFSDTWGTAWMLAVLLFSPIALVIAILLLREEEDEERYRPISILKEETALAAPEFIIAGLGNPGEKYAVTRHNCGFMALDYIALRENVSFKNLRFQSLVCEIELAGKKCLLLKPQTFMNLSGEAVREAAAFYKIPPEKILVLYDDIHFEPGVFRIRKNGSAGGHNGIKSIISCLGSDAFPRVKMGVGQPPEGWDLMHHVLGAFPDKDREKHLNSLEDVYQTTKYFIAGDLDRAMNLFSGKKHGE